MSKSKWDHIRQGEIGLAIFDKVSVLTGGISAHIQVALPSQPPNSNLMCIYINIELPRLVIVPCVLIWGVADKIRTSGK